MAIIIPKPSFKIIELALVLISSLLLGIWATTHTIALRNILLGFASLLSILYWLTWLRGLICAPINLRPRLAAWLPLGLIALMFIWVIIHFKFFSVVQQRQFDELTSTWLRAFLAALIGSATGLALIRSRANMPLMWIGLTLSFLLLMFQYIPKALKRGNIFGVDFFADYIYWAKFNGVLAGTILIAGLLGLLIDRFRSDMGRKGGGGAAGQKNSKTHNYIPAYTLLGIFLASYSFVFIFDAKTGVGLAVILIGFWVLVGSALLVVKIAKDGERKSNINAYFKLGSLFLIFTVLLSFLSYKHIKNNPGWESLFADIVISVQTDKYPNWKNPSRFGVPLRNDGTAVASNTYERVSWATVGLRLIAMEPFGNGVFRSFPEQVKKLAPEFNSAAYTHSAWIDLGLAFGLPGFLLIPLALLIMLGRAITGLSGPYNATIITLSLAILILYGVGEYAFQHGIEILFYLCSLLGALTLVSAGSQVPTTQDSR